jgi:hypothetical protein
MDFHYLSFMSCELLLHVCHIVMLILLLSTPHLPCKLSETAPCPGDRSKGLPSGCPAKRNIKHYNGTTQREISRTALDLLSGQQIHSFQLISLREGLYPCASAERGVESGVESMGSLQVEHSIRSRAKRILVSRILKTFQHI